MFTGKKETAARGDKKVRLNQHNIKQSCFHYIPQNRICQERSKKNNGQTDI